MREKIFRPKFYLRSIRRGVYVLPSLVTSAALFSGFFAIVSAFEQEFEKAAIALMLAVIFDAIDGRVARLMNAETAFGAHYDSLSDMVSFGVAPAVVLFNMGLSSLGEFGWFSAFVYMACAALRLARFNTHREVKIFIGLASPAAATIIASMVLILNDQNITLKIDLLLMVVALVLGFLMVSNIRYWNPKYLQFKRRIPFMSLVFIIVVFATIATYPRIIILFLFVMYALSGPVWMIFRRMDRFRSR